MKRIIACFLCVAMLVTIPICPAHADLSPEMETLVASFPGEDTFTETDISLVKDDGETLRGTLLLPDGEEKSVPLVIMSHGFNSGRNSCAKMAYAFGKSGIASVRFDFGGFGESDGKVNKISVLTEVEDLKEIIDYVKTLDFVDTDHIFLFGNSMGGLVTALTAEERQEDICAVILNYPALSLADGVRAGKCLTATFDVNNLPKIIRSDGVPLGQVFITDIMDMDFYANLDKLAVDVLLIHGDVDDTVDISSSIRASALIPNCTFYVMEGGGHGFEGEQLVEQAQISVAFVQEHLN